MVCSRWRSWALRSAIWASLAVSRVRSAAMMLDSVPGGVGGGWVGDRVEGLVCADQGQQFGAAVEGGAGQPGPGGHRTVAGCAGEFLEPRVEILGPHVDPS
jgi:hypothetical protein